MARALPGTAPGRKETVCCMMSAAVAVLRLRGGVRSTVLGRELEEELQRRTQEERRQARLDRGRAAALQRPASWRETLKRTWRSIKKIVWGHARPRGSAARPRVLPGCSTLPPMQSISATETWDWRHAARELKRQNDLAMFKERKTAVAMAKRREETAAAARPLSHSMAMLGSHVDGSCISAPSAQMPQDIYDYESDEANREEEEAHLATDGLASSDAQVEISLPEGELKHIALDLPVMAVLVDSARREQALRDLQHLLLTPSSPQSSIIPGQLLHRLARGPASLPADPSSPSPPTPRAHPVRAQRYSSARTRGTPGGAGVWQPVGDAAKRSGSRLGVAAMRVGHVDQGARGAVAEEEEQMPPPLLPRLPETAAAALLLNQTMRYARLEHVPGKDGDSLRQVMSPPPPPHTPHPTPRVANPKRECLTAKVGAGESGWGWRR